MIQRISTAVNRGQVQPSPDNNSQDNATPPTIISIRPRALGRRLRIPKAPVIDITLAHILAMSEAGVRIENAAQSVGICTTTFKKVCRKMGISKWGHYHQTRQCSSPPTNDGILTMLAIPAEDRVFSANLAQRAITAIPFPCEITTGTVDDVLFRLENHKLLEANDICFALS